MIRAVEAELSAISPPVSTLEDRAERLVEALAEYHGAVDAGNAPSRDDFLQRYPEIAQELAGYLDGFDFVREVAPQLRGEEEGVNSAPAIAARATLGDFQILREIGRGGMGVVYEAEQISLGRRVALKVLPFAAILDKQQLKRFKNEARAAATLNHPNIVAVYSVGEVRSVYFYAMQLVEGRNLAHVIAELRKTHGVGVGEADVTGGATIHFASKDATPAKSDDPAVLPAAETRRDMQAAVSTIPAFDSREYLRTVAELGIQAAEALDHAHQNGVLHRDIKPANLLVDDSGKLWVTDFGLARLEADAGLTMTGDILGTLRYMSPEQALAQRAVVDHRSDIYSLGVTLYELLTLEPVYQGNDRQELLRQIALEEPRRPRRVNSRIPQDLETIVQKAIEKNANDRYVTAQQLADDLRALLDNRPIKAKPPTILGLAKKWSHRHKPLVASVAVSAAALLVITLGVLAFSNVAITREQGKTNAALEEKANALHDRTTALERSEWNYQKALEAVDQLLARVGNEKLAEVPQLDQLRMDVLKDTLRFYESFVAENPDDRKVQFELAKTYRRVGMMHHDFARYATASLHRDKAIHILEELHRLDPANLDYRFELAVVLIQRGWVGSVSGNNDQPAYIRRAVDLLQTLCDDDPSNMEYKDALADSLRSLAELYLDGLPKIGQSINAALVQQVLERTFAVARLPGVNKRFLAHAHEYSAALAVCQKRLDDAEAEYRESIRIHQLAVVDRPLEFRGREHLLRAYLELADLFQQEEDWEHAEEAYREAVKVGEPLSRDFPAMKNINAFAARALENLARVLIREHRIDEAKDLAAHLSPTRWDEYLIRANLHVIAGEKELSKADCQEVLQRLQRSIGDGPFDYTAAFGIFVALDGVGRRQEALAFVRNMATPDIECVATRVKLYMQFTTKELRAEDPDAILELWSLLIETFPDDYRLRWLRGDTYCKLGKHADAIVEYEGLIAQGADNPLLLNQPVLLNKTAWLLAAAHDDSIRNGKQAVKLATKACELTNFEDEGFVDTLAAAHAEAGDFDKAIEWSQKAIELAKDDQKLLDELTNHLASYQAGRPWRVAEDEQ